MSIDGGKRNDMTVGTRLVATYKGATHEAEVVDGGLYRLADGRTFKSPSSAGKAITGQSVNGWKFWSIAA